MNAMKKMINYLTFAVVLFSAVSCGDWLNVLPQSQIDADRIFQSKDGFYSSLAGVYMKMAERDAYGKALTVSQLEVMGNTLSMYAATYIEPYKDQGMFNGLATYYYARGTRFAKIDNAFTKMWKAAYNVIANDNLLIAHLESADPALFEEGTREILLGEALALRAYVHFDLLRIFQPPYASEEGKTQKRIPYREVHGMEFVPSASSEEMLTKIIGDLEKAAALMKDADPISSGKTYSDNIFKTDRKYKMNYYAVKGLQARVYLYHGDYGKAYDAAMEVIGVADQLGIRFIEDGDLTTKDSQNDYVNRSCPMENIFALTVDELGDYVDMDHKGTNLADGYTGMMEQFRLLSTRYPNYYSSSGDIRMAMWKKKSGSTMYFAKYERPVLEADLAKYPKSAVSMLKLGEMYLIAAEGAAEAVSPGEAVRLLNILQSSRKGGVYSGTDKTAVIQEVLKEYRREMIGDGQVFYAYKRRNVAQIDKGYMASGTIEMSVEKYTPDIPEAEFNGGRTY